MWLFLLIACGPRPEHRTELKDACAQDPDGIVCYQDESAVCSGKHVGSFEECDPATDVCVAGVGCAACPLDAADARIVAPILAEDAPEEAVRLRWVPLGLSTDPSASTGTIRIEATTGVSLWKEDGKPARLPLAVKPSELPVLYVTATSAAGTVTAIYDTGATHCVTRTIEVSGIQFPGLAGVDLPALPRFQWVDTFQVGDPVQVAVDPSIFPNLDEKTVQIAIIAHREAESWLTDPTFQPVVAPVELFLSVEDEIATALAWDASTVGAGQLDTAYDVVLDVDGNGRLDPGDWLDGGVRPGFSVVADLTAAGPHAVTSIDYSAGWWVTQRIYYPSDVSALGELPLVVISHGNGHDYTWYDYLGDHLASWGFVVMTHRNETEPGIETASTTTLLNTDWFLGNLAAIDPALVGHVDPHRIGWIGHSRGGEGVVRAYSRLLTGTYATTAFTADDVLVVSSIAPTVFLDSTQADPHEVPYHVIAGSADGDVTGGVDCDPCQYFRLAGRAQGPLQTTLVQGASHNDFNCCGFADGTGPDLIGRDRAQLVAKSTLLALMSWYLQDDEAMREFFTRMYDDIRPIGVDPDIVVSSTYRTARGNERFIVDDYEFFTDLAVASSGGAVTLGVSDPVEAVLHDTDYTFTWTKTDPMNGMTQTEPYGMPPQDHGLVFDWTSGETPTLDIEIPVGSGDFSGGTWLELRAAQGTRHPETVALDGPLSFSVGLVDGAGVESSIDFASYGMLARPYQRVDYSEGAGWANEFATVRIRLTDFLVGAEDLDLTDVASVRLRFGEGSGSVRGRVGIDDIAVVE